MLLPYLIARLRYWNPAVVRHLKAGMGLERRARMLAPFWAEHMQRTRSAQARWAVTTDFRGQWLTVLGAGRLLDFNRTVLLPRFANLQLVDADRLCLHVWKHLPKPVEPVCVDISGCVDKWLASLKKGKQQPWAETLETIRGKRAPQGSAYRAGGEAVLSLNVLSQLQIVWQDGVEEYLEKRFGHDFVKSHELEWLDALRPAGQTLVKQHLAALERAAPTYVLLITDVEYLEYKGVPYQADHWAPPPVEWTEEDGWCAETEVDCEVSPALEGVALNADTFAEWMPSYRLTWQESWLWHIAPLGTGPEQYGKVHRVGAFALEAREQNARAD